MPERVTKEEKIVELAILKAKEILQEAGHLGRLKLDEDVMGEEMKVKKPKKNPSEEKMPQLSNIDGKEDKVNDGTMKKSILAAVDDLLKAMASVAGDDRDRTMGALNAAHNRISELANLLRGKEGPEAKRITRSLAQEVDKLRMLTEGSGLPSKDIERSPESRRF